MSEIPERFGRLQRGTRPGVLPGEVRVGLVVVVPLTSRLGAIRFPHTVEVKASVGNGLKADSVAMGFQLTTIDARLLIHRVGILEQDVFSLIEDEVRTLLHL